MCDLPGGHWFRWPWEANMWGRAWRLSCHLLKNMVQWETDLPYLSQTSNFVASSRWEKLILGGSCTSSTRNPYRNAIRARSFNPTHQFKKAPAGLVRLTVLRGLLGQEHEREIREICDQCRAAASAITANSCSSRSGEAHITCTWMLPGCSEKCGSEIKPSTNRLHYIAVVFPKWFVDLSSYTHAHMHSSDIPILCSLMSWGFLCVTLRSRVCFHGSHTYF